MHFHLIRDTSSVINFLGIQDEDLYQAYGEVLKTFKLKGMKSIKIMHRDEVLIIYVLM